jgi:hypothetical protein
MKRVWQPLDLAPGFRLYEVKLLWCLKDGRQGTESYIVAADSPNQTPNSAANQIKKIYGESYDNNPLMSYWDVKGYALNVLQPADWFREEDFFSGLSIPESEEIAKAAQEEVNYAFGVAPKAPNLTPPKITPGVVWAVVRAYLDTVRDLSKRT